MIDFKFRYSDEDKAIVDYTLTDDFGWSTFTVVWSKQIDGIWRIIGTDNDR